MPVFSTFINPGAGAVGFGHWTQVISFGQTMPSGRTSGFVHLEVDDPSEATLFAAFTGKLTAQQPTGFLQPAREEIADNIPNGNTLTLYLTPITGKYEGEWKSLTSALFGNFSATADPLSLADALAYLEYRNVSIEKAKSLLFPQLNPAAANKQWQKLLNGDGGGVPVKTGDAIGEAGRTGTGAAPGPLQVHIGLRTKFGMFDPGTWYQEMVTTLAGAAPTNAGPLAQLLGVRMPLIASHRTVQDVGSDRCWPWSALLQYKESKPLSYSEWRDLGNRQKSLYLAQLMARVRPALAPANTPRFEYDVQDMLNVFQLEAVTQFYLNLPDPWNVAQQPAQPGQPVNLLSLYGTDATINNSDITLDGQLDMGRIVAGRDNILLDAEPEANRPGRQFRIMSVDRPNQIVTVDAAPTVARSGWRIFHNPTLVMIDAFGSRVGGANATAAGNPIAPAVKLSQLTDAQLEELNRVNPYDTISLLDVAANTPREARIIDRATIRKSDRDATLKLDREVTPVANGSAWSIPAGVAGVQGSLDKSKYNAKAKWWDNYDGMMFFVAGGEVRNFFPWTSFSSRKKPLSSIQGNLRYTFSSYFSRSNLFINAGFRVVSGDGLLWGDRAIIVNRNDHGLATIAVDPSLDLSLVRRGQTLGFLKSTPKRFSVTTISTVDANVNLLQIDKDFLPEIPNGPSPFWILVYDGTRNNRYYFTSAFRSRSVPLGQIPHMDKNHNVVPGGAMGIRIHLGVNGQDSGSEGCQVSPFYRELRQAIIGYHLESNDSYYQLNKDYPLLDQLSQMHTVQREPPWLQPYTAMAHDVDHLQAGVDRLVSGPLSIALDEALRAETDNERLAALKQGIFNAELNFGVSKKKPKEMADTPSEDQILPELEALLALSSQDDVTELVHWAKDNAETITHLRKTIADLEKKKAQTVQRWGWDDAIHGEYFLIRPDERDKMT